MDKKVLNCANTEDVKAGGSDIETFGNCDSWQLLCKASSKKQGWQKSTKAMEIPGSGCLVQVTTELHHPTSGHVAVAEALCFVPFVKIQTLYGPVPEGVTEFNEGDYPIFGRQLVADPSAFFNSSILSSTIEDTDENGEDGTI
jgi:hypothetical protein